MALTMTRKSVPEPEAVSGQVLCVEDGVPATYPNIDTAEKALTDTLGQDEGLKIRAAKIVQRIRGQELYREHGFTTFSAYLPSLLGKVRNLGWTAERTIRTYLAFADVYLDQLEVPSDEALTAATHLFTLLRLAERDRKSGELRDEPYKDGKLGAAQFEAVVRVITWLVNYGVSSGMNENEVEDSLVKAGLEFELETFRGLVGQVPSIPAGGWTVENTRALVGQLSGKEEKPKLVRVWVAANREEHVLLVTLELYRDDHLLYELPLGKKAVDQEAFEAMVGTDTVRWVKQ